MGSRRGRPASSVFPAVASAVGAAVLGLAVAVSGDLPGDAALLRAARVGRDAAAYGFAQGVDGATGSWPLLAIGVLLGLILRSVQIPVAVALAAAVTAGVKRLVTRERPDLMSPLAEASYSFPAGHAAAAASLVLAVLLIAPMGWRAIAAVIGGAVLVVSAWAQLALTRHFPTDLVAGWLTGGAVALALAWFTERIAARRDG